MTGNSPGNFATYTCGPDYDLVGISLLVCGENRQWSAEPPICRPVCTILKIPANGTLILTGTSHGSTATYTCDSGFALVGSETLTCGEDGMWSDPPPVCQRVVAVYIILKTPANGTLILTGTSHGNTATYTCDTGFALVGSETLTCGEDGMWSDPPPVCQRVVAMCTILKTPANGTLILTGTSHGSTATYTCDSGFALVGSETLICGEDGMWSDPPPVCQRVVAVYIILKTPANGTLILTGTSHGNTATYTCDTGFALVGSETLTCGEDGMWSDPPPVCQRVVVERMECGVTLLLSARELLPCVLF
jgi:CUB/sushi domain-containing protein